MKIKYLKLKNWLLLSLGTLLGLQMGCGKDHNEEPISGMYGCPEGTYHVMGTVVNEEGEPVAGINVSHLDTTGVDGHYEIRLKDLREATSQYTSKTATTSKTDIIVTPQCRWLPIEAISTVATAIGTMAPPMWRRMSPFSALTNKTDNRYNKLKTITLL